MWIEITASSIQAALSGPELAAYQSAALADGQGDPLHEIISQAVEEARGYIASGSFALEVGATIPFRLQRSVVSLIRYRLITRLPIRSGELLEHRRREYDDAIRLLERVAEGKFNIEEPEETDPTEPPARGRFGSNPKVRF